MGKKIKLLLELVAAFTFAVSCGASVNAMNSGANEMNSNSNTINTGANAINSNYSVVSWLNKMYCIKSHELNSQMSEVYIQIDNSEFIGRKRECEPIEPIDLKDTM